MSGTVICFDFDGTLVDGSGGIHQNDIEILKNERSVSLVPATGRPLHSVRNAFEAHGLFREGPIPFPLILENGTVVYDENESLREQHSFPKGVRDTLLAAAFGAPEITFLMHGVGGIQMLHPSEWGDYMVRRFSLSVSPFSENSEESPVESLVKLVMISDDTARLSDFSKSFEDLRVEQAFSLPTTLEFTPPGIDKGKGLKNLLGDSFSRTKIIVAGDGENDLPLFALTDSSFAPEDSPKEIKARAQHTINVAEEGLFTPILRTL